jgi:hypothetical protein
MRAVEWTANLAEFFPWLRVEETAVLQFAEDIAHELGPNDGVVPAERIEEGVALVSTAERRRLVEHFARRQPDQWAGVRADAGDTPALERSLVRGAVRAAIVERRLPATSRLADLESGKAPAHSPRDVLAVTLLPETVWSAPDEQAAEQAAADAETEREWLRAVMAVAVERSHEAHARRVQVLAAALQRRLPARGFSAASAMLDDAYVRTRSRGFAETVALALLPAYVARQASHTLVRGGITN